MDELAEAGDRTLYIDDTDFSGSVQRLTISRSRSGNRDFASSGLKASNEIHGHRHSGIVSSASSTTAGYYRATAPPPTATMSHAHARVRTLGLIPTAVSALCNCKFGAGWSLAFTFQAVLTRHILTPCDFPTGPWLGFVLISQRQWLDKEQNMLRYGTRKAWL